MNELGFSPFGKFFRDQSPVFGTVRFKNLTMFNYLVKDTRWRLPKSFDLDKKCPTKHAGDNINKYTFDDSNR